jgi:hypothetical protein
VDSPSVLPEDTDAESALFHTSKSEVMELHLQAGDAGFGLTKYNFY